MKTKAIVRQAPVVTGAIDPIEVEELAKKAALLELAIQGAPGRQSEYGEAALYELANDVSVGLEKLATGGR
jgi:hypothetical protein